ncbi:MAG: SusC/RagA family TonB-linked outer membrane protein, partial [Chitinophagaceae bacterium]
NLHPLVTFAQEGNINHTSTVRRESLKKALLDLEKKYHTHILFEDKVVNGLVVNSNFINEQADLEMNLTGLLKPFHLIFEKTNGDSYIILSGDHEGPDIPGANSHPNQGGILNHPGQQRVGVSPGQKISEGPPQQDQQPGIDGVIKGKVVDMKGTPLEGASVTLEGSNAGTTTNQDGLFALPIPKTFKKGRLIVGYLGFGEKEIAFTDQSFLLVTLNNQQKNLNDLVVVGYGSQKKGDLTGSIATIATKGLSTLPVANIGEAMEGRAAGVQVISSGSPGSNVTFRIRGVGTINDADPLLVIDGIPTDAPLNNINPDDIASIEILKDASASAIYGSRGANGVIIITTKNGVAGQNHLSFHVFTGFQSPTNVVQMLNAAQFATLNNEMLVNNGQPKNPAYANPSSLGSGTNWLRQLFGTGTPMQSYSLAYSGGTKKSSYYVSGSVFNQQGIVIHTSYKRYTVQFNTTTQLFPWLKFGNNLTLTADVKPSGDYDIRNTMAANPTQPVYNADGSYSGPVGQPQWYGDITNPIGKATIVNNNTSGYNLLGSVFSEATLLPHLNFKTNLGIQANFYNSRTWAPKYNWQPIPQPNSFLSEQYNKSLTWLWDNYFTYDRTFNEVNHLTVLAGISSQENKYSFINGSVSDFASDLTQQLSNGTSQTTLGGDASEWALLSYIGRINYAYKDKYLLTATIRRDGSSRFGPNNKWGTFPSLSAAWRISNEAFLQKFHFINDLKLRAGYGLTGNQNIGNYSFASVLTTAVYNFNGQTVPATVAQQIPNPNVKWETVEQSNIGLDATLFKRRLDITLDAYIKNTTNMLVPESVPISSGYSDIYVPFINAGKVQNKGIELSVTTVNLTGNLKWSTNFNISYNENKIISLNDSVPIHTGNASIGGNLNYNVAIQQAGHPVNEFYGYQMMGIFQTQAQVDNAAVQVPGADPYNRTSPGDIEFRDLNNDGVINEKDRTFIGNPNPKFIFAMNNSFSYKGFDLTIFLQGVEGNKIFNANNIYQEGMSVAQNQTTYALGRWEGPGTSTLVPRAVYNDPNGNTRQSSRYIEDGSYLRIKNITLGYNLPNKMIKRFKMYSVRIYASCENLYTFTRYSGFDPEVAANGIDYSVYPVTRTISIGINLSL